MRRAMVVAVLVALVCAPACGSGHADEPGPVRQVVLMVEDRVAFEELLSVPAFRRLASAGGSALMTTRTREPDPREQGGEEPSLAYQTIGWGTVHVPVGGGAPPMNRAATAAGIDVCSYLDPSTVRRAGAPTGYLSLPGDGRGSHRCSEGSPTGRRLWVVDSGASYRFDTGACGRGASPGPDRQGVLREDSAALSRAIMAAGAGGGSIGVVVVVPSPSCAMGEVGDEVTPFVLAIGTADQLLEGSGRLPAVRSDTTRRSGLISNVDVAPTVLRLFGTSIPGSMDGSAVRMVDDPAPFRLHRLHLEQRRIRLPIQIGEVSFVAALAIVGVAALLWLGLGRSLPPRLGAALRYLAVCAAAMEIPLMLGGLLPHLTYAWAVPFLVLGTLTMAEVVLLARWPGPAGPFVLLGWAGLGVVVVDALFGWRGAGVPLLGGTMFDGVRFFGIPNAFIALLLASALFVAFALQPLPGFAVLVGAGLLAGFPSLGANVGASIVLFTAAGMWWVLRTGRRFGARQVAVVAGVVLAGLAVVLAVNRFLPGTPTHLTRFVERSESGPGVILDSIRHRLSVGAGQIRQVPAALLPLVGLPIVLWLTLRRPAPIGPGLALAGPAWRDVVVSLAVAGMVAYVVNDTGVAAAAPVFLYAITAMAYPAYLAARSRAPA